VLYKPFDVAPARSGRGKLADELVLITEKKPADIAPFVTTCVGLAAKAAEPQQWRRYVYPAGEGQGMAPQQHRCSAKEPVNQQYLSEHGVTDVHTVEFVPKSPGVTIVEAGWTKGAEQPVRECWAHFDATDTMDAFGVRLLRDTQSELELERRQSQATGNLLRAVGISTFLGQRVALDIASPSNNHKVLTLEADELGQRKRTARATYAIEGHGDQVALIEKPREWL
jgi:hypothetical protein